MKRPTLRQFASALYNLGFRYYETGTMRNADGSKAGDYWKGNDLSDNDKKHLIETFGDWVAFYKAQAQYAPEQIKPVVLLRSPKKK